jgi:hypothetical protein
MHTLAFGIQPHHVFIGIGAIVLIAFLFGMLLNRR